MIPREHCKESVAVVNEGRSQEKQPGTTPGTIRVRMMSWRYVGLFALAYGVPSEGRNTGIESDYVSNLRCKVPKIPPVMQRSVMKVHPAGKSLQLGEFIDKEKKDERIEVQLE